MPLLSVLFSALLTVSTLMYSLDNPLLFEETFNQKDTSSFSTTFASLADHAP